MFDQKYLELLSVEYPTIGSAASEIINLKAIQCLPKGTEYFFSDLHGEYEPFLHLLKSASGMIRAKIDNIFENSISDEECSQLATLIYYPEEEIENIKCQTDNFEDWCKVTMYRLVQVCKEVSRKYTRSKVRKKMPADFAYIIDELLHGDHLDINKKSYYSKIIHSIIDAGMAEKFICKICVLIQHLSIDNLHIIGDVYDRGPRPDIIMNELINFHDVDIEWGNHDISWMGAASGNLACIANVIRMGVSYNTFDLLEDGYGINLRALSIFALETYKEDPCERFLPHILDENKYDYVDVQLAAKMHKAITVIQFKLEGQLIKEHPEYGMDERNVLEKINYENGTIELNGSTYELVDKNFPTISPEAPLKLTDEEEVLIRTLAASFSRSRLLEKHVKFIYSNGGVYKCINNNLLYHGCIPMENNGTFARVKIGEKFYKGKEYLDYITQLAYNAYNLPLNSPDKKEATDFMWYLWCGPKSPLFGKSKMAAFENYFILEKEPSEENLDPYYRVSLDEDVCNMILEEFGLDSKSGHIINGHVPVKIIKGEKPVKANGKLFFIDGGISKAYQPKTGIAGYTLIYNSKQLSLAEHKPFQNDQNGIIRDNTPKIMSVEIMKERVTVAKTDVGKRIAEKIESLEELLKAYKDGTIKEKN
nr:fructose-1,6-bisphosphatase [uncultured Anaerocolumna sp.]